MLGCDIVELYRIEDSIEKFGDKFIDRILTKNEKQIFIKRKKSVSFLAGRFSAKESISKSLKSGIGKLNWTDIEILNGENGEPVVYLYGEKRADIELSISHSKDYAMAVSLIKD